MKRLALAVAVLLAGCATRQASPSLVLSEATGGSGNLPGELLPCGAAAVPPGWPDFSTSAEQLLAPFLTCTSPAAFLALQQGVDMPRLVEQLDDWHAARLGAQGPMREEAAGILNRKRTSLLLHAAERYGLLPAQVLAVFIVNTSHDDDLREVLFLLTRDKQLAQTLALLPSFQSALESRGLRPTALADRNFQWSDLGRGLAQAGKDALSSSPMSADASAFNFAPIRGQLPPPYRQALEEAEKHWAEQHFSAGNVVLGGFDQLTFGVPLGFYGLLAGTGQGASALYQGEYEQALRQLAPAVVLVAVYAGGKGVRALAEGQGTPWLHVLTGPEAMRPRLRTLLETVRRLEGLLGVDGLRELARYIQASREAGRFVAVGGEEAALALYEAQGDVARARPLLSKARPGATGAPPERARIPTRGGDMASLVDREVGLTPEVVEAKFAAVEHESTGPRLPRDVGVLEKQRPSLDAPPPEARGNARWHEYVAYYEKRLGEVKEGKATQGPLPWEAYEQLRGWFARGLAFERVMVKLLEADARRPRAERRFLGDFDKPRIETNVGVKKPGPGLRYADVLIIEEGEVGGRPRRVETFSFKSRAFSALEETRVEAQMIADAKEALRNYGETLDIRRDSIHSLLSRSREVRISRVRLIYERITLDPTHAAVLDSALDATKTNVPGVEVSFQ